jgi:hypothetical protein
MLTVFTLAAAIILGGIISLATNNWLFLILAIGLHFIVSALVLGFVFKATNSGDKPDPVTEAHMDAGDIPKDKRGGLTRSGRRDDREVVL